MRLKRDDKIVELTNEVQIAAYLNSGFVEVKAPEVKAPEKRGGKSGAGKEGGGSRKA